MSIAVDLVVDPSNPKRRYELYSNGYIRAIGGALPVESVLASVNDNNSGKAPLFYDWPSPDIAKAIYVVDWDIPSGYTLSAYGHVWAWGGVANVPGTGSHFLTGGPEYLYGLNGGFPSPTIGWVNDFTMNPAGDGTGYFLKFDGGIVAFGTGVTAVAQSSFLLGITVGIRMVMDWTSKRYWVGDRLGRIWGRNGGNNRPVGGPNSFGGVQPAGAQVWGRTCMGFVLYDKTANAAGWMIDAFGRVYPIGSAAEAPGFQFTPYWAPIWQDIGIIDAGLGTSPQQLVAMQSTGGLYEWVSSTAPTVTVISPANPTTTATRPWVRANYLDAEGDALTAWKIRVFDSATYGAGGFAPATSIPLFEASGTTGPIEARLTTDLTNGSYRAYAQATDASNLTSTWAYVQWVQNVTRPAAPTLAATADDTSHTVALTLTGVASGYSAAVEYQDADSTVWELVTGAYDLPETAGAVTVTDTEARLGVTRSYRAVTYTYTDDDWLASPWSTTQTATLTAANRWLLTDPARAVGGTVLLSAAYESVETVLAAVVTLVGRRSPVVLSDGPPKLGHGTLSVWSLTPTDRAELHDLVDGDSTLLLRDPVGRSRFVRCVGDVTFSPLEEDIDQETYDVRIDVQEIDRPAVGPLTGPLAP